MGKDKTVIKFLKHELKQDELNDAYCSYDEEDYDTYNLKDNSEEEDHTFPWNRRY